MTAVATPETPALDLKQAQRLTERARLVATTLMEARDKLATILAEAEKGRVWEALDMPNIQAWTEFAFSTTPLAQLSREDRRVIVKELAAEGYGTRAIAPIVGKSHMSVARDLASVTDVTDEPPAPREVHGRDGITRTFQPRPAPEPDVIDAEIVEDDEAHPGGNENWHTDYANGVRNDMEARSRLVIEYLEALAKHLPEDNVHPGAVARMQGALLDQKWRIDEAFKAALLAMKTEIGNNRTTA